MRISVKTALNAVVGLLAAFLLVQGGLGLMQLKAMKSGAAEVTENRLPSIRQLAEIKQAITHHRLHVASLIIDEDPTATQVIDERIIASSRRIDDLFKAYEPLISDDTERATWAEFRSLWAAEEKAQNQAASLKRLTDRSGASDILARSMVDFEKTLAVLDRNIALNGALTDEDARQIGAAYDAGLLQATAMGGIGLLLAIGAGTFVVFGISGPLRGLTWSMQAIAEGDLAADIPSVDRANEIGDMARTLVVFRDGLAEADRLRADQIDKERALGARMSAERREIADRFMATMGALSQRFVGSAAAVADAARHLSATSEATTQQATTVSAAAEEASSNVQTVAAATEELEASVREIGGQVDRSTQVAETAALEAANTEVNIRGLSQAAEKIGDVVNLIRDIAGQTNLLALNATIEAARAGEAGRGFAVVASEVKQLASQTAKATDEIAQKIGEIQSATAETVGSIGSIVATIGSIREVTSSIAGAVTQQSAAASEISGNTHRAAQGAARVTDNIAGVGRAAEDTGAAATRLSGLSGELTAHADELTTQVQSFVATLRSA